MRINGSEKWIGIWVISKKKKRFRKVKFGKRGQDLKKSYMKVCVVN